MRISDWSSDVGSSDLRQEGGEEASCEEGCQEGHQEDGEEGPREACQEGGQEEACQEGREEGQAPGEASCEKGRPRGDPRRTCADDVKTRNRSAVIRLPLRMPRRRGSFFGSSPPKSRSEEHTSELQSLMRNSYADFCLKKKNTNT